MLVQFQISKVVLQMERVAPPDAPKPPKQGIRSAARAHTVARDYDPGYDPDRNHYQNQKMWVNYKGEPRGNNSRFASKPLDAEGNDFEDEYDEHRNRQTLRASWDYAAKKAREAGFANPLEDPQYLINADTHLQTNYEMDMGRRTATHAMFGRLPGAPPHTDTPANVDVSHSRGKVAKRLTVRKAAAGLPEEIQERIAGYKRPSEKSLKSGADPEHPSYDSALTKRIRAMLDDYSAYNRRSGLNE